MGLSQEEKESCQAACRRRGTKRQIYSKLFGCNIRYSRIEYGYGTQTTGHIYFAKTRHPGRPGLDLCLSCAGPFHDFVSGTPGAGAPRGIPTGSPAPPLVDMIAQPDEPPPVWPDPEGKVRGYEFSPLFKSVPKAAARDKRLYELLVLVDAIRGGRARERDIAVKELRARLKG